MQLKNMQGCDMQLQLITEQEASAIITTCMYEGSLPKSFRDYVFAHFESASARNYGSGKRLDRHKLLTKLSKDCGFHSYKILNKVAKHINNFDDDIPF